MLKRKSDSHIVSPTKIAKEKHKEWNNFPSKLSDIDNLCSV